MVQRPVVSIGTGALTADGSSQGEDVRVIARTPQPPRSVSTASSLLDRPERRLLGLFIALSAIELVSEVVDSQIGQWATKPFLMPVLICLLIMSIGVEGNRLVVAALATVIVVARSAPRIALLTRRRSRSAGASVNGSR